MRFPTLTPPRPRSGLIWFAAALVAAAAVLPAFGMLLRAAAPGLVTVELCSAGRVRHIVLAVADTPDSDQAPQATPHCPLCAGPTAVPGLPPANDITFAVVAGAAAVRSVSRTPLRPAPSFRIALSRAPPARA